MTIAEDETRIRENKEGRIQERGHVMVLANPGQTPEDTLIYLPRYKANPSKKILEDDLGLLSETMRLDPQGRREAPLQAAARGYWEEMGEYLSTKSLLVAPRMTYSTLLFDTRKGWDTDVSHVQGYLSVFWVNDRSQFPLTVDTEEMKGAEWLSIRNIMDRGAEIGFRQSPPSPLPVIEKLHLEGFFGSRAVNLQPIDWFAKIKPIGPASNLASK